MTRIAEIADRLHRLAKRREDEGIYTDAALCEEAADALAAIGAGTGPLNMPTDPAWYEGKAKLEDGHEIGAGKRTATINPTAEEIAEMERLQFEALPKWAQDEITKLRAAIGAGGQAVAAVAADQVFDAVLSCSHSIDAQSVILKTAYDKPGNALKQLHDRITAALSQPHPADERVVEARNYETFRTFAHEATKAITNLTGGGSEYFGKEVDGVFLADIPRCVERLRHRLDRAALSAKEAR